MISPRNILLEKLESGINGLNYSAFQIEIGGKGTHFYKYLPNKQAFFFFL
ncbi:hypothetical protein EVA_12936 [gut metagenome]|uniref:Uncharacterized protein n=1 Tax=gut metagenome TaxID=749906 RepID=J9FVC7_9ZZZZ